MPFQKGNQERKGKSNPNAGRKTDKDLRDLQSVLDEAIPHEERVQIFQIASARARAGDSGFAKIVLGYLYGTPIQRTEISGAGGAPIEITTIEAVKPANARSDRD